MAALGHDVIGIDVDATKVVSLSSGHAPFFEPGLSDLLAEGVAAGRLRFSTDAADAADADVHFIAVGTPEGPDGAADLRYVDAAVDAIASLLVPGALVVGKSTVPIGTAAAASERIAAAGGHLAWNPEFLREGFAVQDTLRPDRLVYGVVDGDERSVQMLDTVYADVLVHDMPRL